MGGYSRHSPGQAPWSRQRRIRPSAENLLINNMFIVYILKSKQSGNYYIGHTSDIINRLEQHNAGKGKSTRNKGPWKLVYKEEFETK